MAMVISVRRDGEGLWPDADLVQRLFLSQLLGESGLIVLIASFSESDPNVWSGRAVQEVFVDPAVRSRINVSGLCLERALRAIMDISAHAI